MRVFNLQTNLLCFNIHELPVVGSLLLPGKRTAVTALRQAVYKWHTSIKRNQINMTIISFAAGGAAIFLAGKWDAPVQHGERSTGLGTAHPQPLIAVLLRPPRVNDSQKQ